MLLAGRNDCHSHRFRNDQEKGCQSTLVLINSTTLRQMPSLQASLSSSSSIASARRANGKLCCQQTLHLRPSRPIKHTQCAGLLRSSSTNARVFSNWASANVGTLAHRLPQYRLTCYNTTYCHTSRGSSLMRPSEVCSEKITEQTVELSITEKIWGSHPGDSVCNRRLLLYRL